MITLYGSPNTNFLFSKVLKTSEQDTIKAPIGSLEQPECIDVLIPVHNEEKLLENTIHSIKASFRNAQVSCRILVALDSCSDGSQEIALKHADFVFEVKNHSKWKTINTLVEFSESSWVAMADVGISWPENLVKEILIYKNNPDYFFVAPSYKLKSANLGQRLNWFLESYQKHVENYFGGPITVHGATVFYSLAHLKKVLSELKYYNYWLNDDVIIPLTMRALFKDQKGIYLKNLKVMDSPSDRPSLNRRQRISLGNLQVINFIHEQRVEIPFVVRFLWLRRLVRIFWGYLILLTQFMLIFLVGVFAKTHGYAHFYDFVSSMMFAVALSLFVMSKTFRSSLFVPLQFLKNKILKKESKVKWN